MAITSISIDEETFRLMGVGEPEVPLTPALQMRPLGPLVVLAGANGAGKSRLLRLLANAMLKQNSVEGRATLQRNHADAVSLLSTRRRELAESQERYGGEPLNESQAIERARVLESHEREVASALQNLKGIEESIKVASVAEMTSGGPPHVVRFVPQSAKLQDPSRSVEADATERGKRVRNLGTDNAESNVPAYARDIMRAALHDRDKRRESSGTELTPDELAAASLIELVRALVGDDFIPNIDRGFQLCLGRWRNYESTLSEGQQVLFQFACMLHAQEASLHDCLVIMDEPENHLHPAVLNQVVDKLRAVLKDGQLWVATHSVPLIAHAVAISPDCLWYVDGGRAKHAGRTPERVLESLMGGSRGAQNLHDLTLLPAHYATLRFMSECLAPPTVVGAKVKDPQTNQIARVLQARRPAPPRKLRVLDYGAGKARLLATLATTEHAGAEWLDYIAFDVSLDEEADRQREISTLYGPEARKRSFVDMSDLSTHVDRETVDVVVMCNVLHEIDPDTWLDLFGNDGALTRLLAPGGALLVVEDYGIPVGERAHRYGFLLLDEPELSVLFAVSEPDRLEGLVTRETAAEAKYRERLVAHLISRDCVARATASTRGAAISKLHDRMMVQLEATLQGAGSGSDEGRSYARTSQLQSNAAIWLKRNWQR